MIKYFVVWYVIHATHLQAPPVVDPYIGNTNAVYAISVYKTTKELKSKEFETEKAAREFIDHAPNTIKKRMKLIDASADELPDSIF